jgi:hypothetical protein
MCLVYPIYLTTLNLYHPRQPYAGPQYVLANGLARHMQVSMCLLGSKLNVNDMPKTLVSSTEIIGIQICLLKVNLTCLTKKCTTTYYP